MNKYLRLLVILALTLCSTGTGYAQRVYASLQKSFPESRIGNTEVKEQHEPISSPDGDKGSRIEVKDKHKAAYQILSFPQSISPYTPIRLALRVRKGLSTSNGLTIQAVSGESPVGAPLQMNNLVGLLNEDEQKEITLLPGQEYDGIRILAESLESEMDVEVFYAYYIAPPQIFANPVIVCNGDPAELGVSPRISGYTYNWYTVPTGGSAFATNNTGIWHTPPLTSPTTYYVEALESPGGAMSARVPVAVEVKPSPALAPISPQQLCEGQSIDLTAHNPVDENGSSSGTYNWSLVQGGKALLSTTVTPSAGKATYWVRYTNNGCFDDTQISITTTARPKPITVTLSKN